MAVARVFYLSITRQALRLRCYQREGTCDLYKFSRLLVLGPRITTFGYIIKRQGDNSILYGIQYPRFAQDIGTDLTEWTYNAACSIHYAEIVAIYQHDIDNA